MSQSISSTDTSPISLAQKLANLRGESPFAEKDPAEALTPFPLWAFLTIYNKASTQCYVDYMRGAQLLAAYLSPIESPPPPSYNWEVHCGLIGGYSSNRLSKVLGIPESLLIQTLIDTYNIETNHDTR